MYIYIYANHIVILFFKHMQYLQQNLRPLKWHTRPSQDTRLGFESMWDGLWRVIYMQQVISRIFLCPWIWSRASKYLSKTPLRDEDAASLSWQNGCVFSNAFYPKLITSWCCREQKPSLRESLDRDWQELWPCASSSCPCWLLHPCALFVVAVGR